MLGLVLEKLLEQDCQALDINGDCKFRGEKGTKCAVGLFIPDEEYDPDMEAMTLCDIQRDYPDLELWNLLPIHIWSDLQHIHDWVDPEDFEREVTENIEALMLKYPQYA